MTAPAPRSSRLRGALVVVLLAVAGAANAQTAGPWQALYREGASATPVVLDLTLHGSEATARLLLPKRSETLDGEGTYATDGSVRLTLRDASGRDVGVLEGKRSLSPNDDGRAFQGRLVLGGSSVPVALERFAQVVHWQVSEGPIQVALSYPRFEGPALRALDAQLEPWARARLDAFLAQGRLAQSRDEVFHGWQLLSDTRLEGIAGDTVSLLTSAYTYTGGAHGNHRYLARTWQLDVADPAPLDLAELFRPGAPFLARIAPLVLADLRARNATWVVDGEVTQLSDQDLALFTLTPAGLAFTFPPYAMGPYAQGTFTVVVPYAAVLDLARPGGALEAFAGAR